MTDYQRIEQLLKHFDMNARSLSLVLGLKSPQIFYDIKAGKCGISKMLATKIQEHLVNISEAWLLTGKGKMLISSGNTTMDSKERIESLSSYLNINIKAMAERCGYDRPQAFYDIQRGKTKEISTSMTNKIISAFPEINRIWLRTGEGEMLKSSEKLDTDIPKTEPVSTPKNIETLIETISMLQGVIKDKDELIEILRKQITELENKANAV